MTTCGSDLWWWGLYRRDYDLANAESMEHPAKASWDLGFRILGHLEELGLLRPGSTVLDPLAGTGRFLIAACARGYRAVGVELEPKFVAMCQANKEYAGRKLGRVLDWEIIQGDARNLSGLLKERGLVAVSSSPYFDSGTGIDKEAHNRQVISHGSKGFGTQLGDLTGQTRYGATPGQIGKLPDRPLTAITSPPYMDIIPGRLDEVGRRKKLCGYPDKPKQSLGGDRTSATVTAERLERQSTGNIGHIGANWKGEPQESYLSAMSHVYAEIARVADVLVVVVKNPTRQGKLRDLAGDTMRLLEATGWRINCVHQAMLFEETEQGDMFGGSQKRVKGRMSFFKRLAWQKGSPVAQWEDIIFAVGRNRQGGMV